MIHVYLRVAYIVMGMDAELTQNQSKVFWNNYYSNIDLTGPSDFSLNFASKYLDRDFSVLELGCGNGRDVAALAINSKSYLGLDISEEAIKFCLNFKENQIKWSEKTNFKVFDFSKISSLLAEYIDEKIFIYSRFTLHSITYAQQVDLLESFAEKLNKESIILIETRTIFDDLYGRGDFVEKDAFMSDHFRRFINPSEFKDEVAMRFNILEWEVGKNFAIYKSENPIVLRTAFKPR